MVYSFGLRNEATCTSQHENPFGDLIEPSYPAKVHSGKRVKLKAEFWINLAVLVFLLGMGVYATFKVAAFSKPLGNLSKAQKKLKRILELLYPPP